MTVRPMLADGRVGFVIEAESDAERVILSIAINQARDFQENNNRFWIHSYGGSSDHIGYDSFYIGTLKPKEGEENNEKEN